MQLRLRIMQVQPHLVWTVSQHTISLLHMNWVSTMMMLRWKWSAAFIVRPALITKHWIVLGGMLKLETAQDEPEHTT